MLKDLVLKNRSYRGFDETRSISREELIDIVEYARISPASVNKQPLKYRLVYQNEDLEKLRPEAKWAKALAHLNLPYEGKQPTAFIAICQDITIDDALARYQKDIGIVAEVMLLRAVEMGLGGCMIGNFGSQSVSDALDLEEHLKPMLLVAIGKPDDEIVLVNMEDSGDTLYYRDKNDVHYVPKRSIEDIII